MTSKEARQQIQALLHVAEDGVIGPKTLQALTTLSGMPDGAPWPSVAQQQPNVQGWYSVTASSFADPADVTAFRKCKAEGNSDLTCFARGDNGVGKWGDDCTEGSGPSCALPPEDWAHLDNPRGALVAVQANGRQVLCHLKDTLPHKANIHNGAGIDLNPDACAALGFTPPIMEPVRWGWA